MRGNLAALFGAVALLAALAPLAAQEAGSEPTLVEAVAGGNVALDLRWRLEAVDQSELYEDDAFASTLRTVLSYRTARWRGLEAFLELEDVHRIGPEDTYRDLGADGGNGVTDRPAIADPEVTEVNQAALVWAPASRLRATLGRQEILVDTQRFVGNVGWRQNHQSFDAVRLDIDLGAGTAARYALLGQVNRIFGDSLPMSSHVLEVAHTFGSAGTLRGYGVLLDYDDAADAALSRDSWGVSWTGSATLGATSVLSYRLEAARQTDAGDNPARVDAGYRRVDLGLRLRPVSFGVGYEVLGGSPEDDRFLTPLATLHGFNGWADVFLTTPENGLRDLFASAGAALGAWKLDLVWHRFTADTGPQDYGSELDLQALWTLPWKQTVGLKGALYDADDLGVDTDKVMLWTQWGF